MRGLRIAVDARILGRRGVGRYLASLLQAMVKLAPQDHFVLFVGPRSQREQIPKTKNIKVIDLPLSHPALLEQWDIPALARKQGCDLLHSPDNTGPLSAGLPLVLTMHDSMWRRPLSQAIGRINWSLRLQDIYRKWVCPRAAHGAARVITISEFSKGDLLGALKLSADKLCVIPEAVHSDFCKPLSAAKKSSLLKGMKIRGSYVLASGAADKRKNIDRLIRAFARAAHSKGLLSKCRLVITSLREGELESTTYLNTAKELNVEKKIMWPGYVSDDEMKALYQGALCFAFPSLWEGFGLPILEAYSLGCPVIASDSTAVKETAGAGALLVDPENTAALEQALLAAAKPSLRKRLIAEGKKELKKYSWNKAAKATLAVYRQAAK